MDWYLHNRAPQLLITHSDLYEVYQKFDFQTAPMDGNESTPWKLYEDHGDGTVRAISDFIVGYMNNDMMVRLNLYPMLVPLSSCLSTTHRILAHR